MPTQRVVVTFVVLFPVVLSYLLFYQNKKTLLKYKATEYILSLIQLSSNLTLAVLMLVSESKPPASRSLAAPLFTFSSAYHLS